MLSNKAFIVTDDYLHSLTINKTEVTLHVLNKICAKMSWDGRPSETSISWISWEDVIEGAPFSWDQRKDIYLINSVRMSWEGRHSETSISRISCEDVVGDAQELADVSIFLTNHGRGRWTGFPLQSQRGSRQNCWKTIGFIAFLTMTSILDTWGAHPTISPKPPLPEGCHWQREPWLPSLTGKND